MSGSWIERVDELRSENALLRWQMKRDRAESHWRNMRTFDFLEEIGVADDYLRYMQRAANKTLRQREVA